MKPGDKVILRRAIHPSSMAGVHFDVSWPAGTEVVVREVTPRKVAVSWLGHPHGPTWTVVGRGDVRPKVRRR